MNIDPKYTQPKRNYAAMAHELGKLVEFESDKKEILKKETNHESN